MKRTVVVGGVPSPAAWKNLETMVCFMNDLVRGNSGVQFNKDKNEVATCKTRASVIAAIELRFHTSLLEDTGQIYSSAGDIGLIEDELVPYIGPDVAIDDSEGGFSVRSATNATKQFISKVETRYG